MMEECTRPLSSLEEEEENEYENKEGREINESLDKFTIRVKCTSPMSDGNNISGDYTVQTTSKATILCLKEAVRDAVGESAQGRYLRLIASGRLLAPDSGTVGSFRIGDGDCIHAVLAAAGVSGGHQAALSRGMDPNTASLDGRLSSFRSRVARDSRSGMTSTSRRHPFRGVGVGPTGLVLTTTSLSDNDDDDDLEAGEERLGFDRLRATGLTRDEIAAIRIYFSRQIDRFIAQRNRLREIDRPQRRRYDGINSESNISGLAETERISSPPSSPPTSSSSNPGPTSGSDSFDARQERLLMEDAWMAAQGPNSEFRLNLNANNPLLVGGAARNLFFREGTVDGTTANDTTAFRGRGASPIIGTDRDFILGFIMGFVMGFVMIFWVWMPAIPHKQKLGILTGICFHMAMNMMKDDDAE